MASQSRPVGLLDTRPWPSPSKTIVTVFEAGTELEELPLLDGGGDVGAGGSGDGAGLSLSVMLTVTSPNVNDVG